MAASPDSTPAMINRPLLRRSRRGPVAAILAVVIIAAAFRFVRLDCVPPAINHDEAVNAYDAYCLRTTGTDHYGTRWPVFVRGTGLADHRGVPFIFILCSAQTFLGMNVWSTRLSPAILGTLNVLLVYLLVKRLYGHRAALLAALMLAVSPWHIHISRLAFEVSVCPPLVTLALLLVVTAGASGCRGRRAPISLFLAGFLFGITLWTYNAMRVFVPLLLLGAAVLYARQILAFLRLPRGRLGAAAFLAGLGLGTGPFVWATIATPAVVWGRALSVSILHGTAGPWDAANEFLRNYAVYFSPSYLFLSGDASLVQSVPGYGQLHLFCAVLLPLGLYRIVRRWRTERFGHLLLWWLLVAPVPAALTKLEINSGHALRSAGALPAYQILAAIGLDMVLTAAQRRSRGIYHASLAASAAAIAACTAYFAYVFFVVYPPLAAPYFMADWPPVFEEIHRRQADYDAVVLPYGGTKDLLYLFTTRTDPREYFRLPRFTYETPTMDAILRIGNVYFHPGYFVKKIMPNLPDGARVLVADSPPLPPGSREVRRFNGVGDHPPIVLYETSLKTR